jgi:hypothetical protein
MNNDSAMLTNMKNACFWTVIEDCVGYVKNAEEFEECCKAADSIFGAGFRYIDLSLPACGEDNFSFREAMIAEYKHMHANYDDSTFQFASHCRDMCIALKEWGDDDEEEFSRCFPKKVGE